jgi:outer membrane immunogenic protein
MNRPSRILGGALFVAVAMTGQGHTADLGGRDRGSFKDEPVPSDAFVWTGFYIGAHAGYGFGDSSSVDGGTQMNNPQSQPPHGAFSCAGPAIAYCDVPFEIEPEGWLAGGQIGYNHQFGSLVLGIEGELAWLNANEEAILDRPLGDQDILSVEYSWYGTLALRAGLAMDRVLIYAKGGLAFAQIETFASDIDLGFLYAGSTTRDSGVETGWALGGGIEYAITDSVSLKAEYLYMDFGSSESRSSDGDVYEHEHSLHTAKVGLNIRLSDAAGEPLK